jgi:hypothetical protein
MSGAQQVDEPAIRLLRQAGSVLGQPDHRQATAAALLAGEREDLTVLAWAIPTYVALALNAEFGTAFLGREAIDLDISIEVDRHTQRAAIGHHASQSTDIPSCGDG